MAGGVELNIKAYVTYVWNGYYTFWFLRKLSWMIICSPLLWILLKRRKYYWPEIFLVIFLIFGMKGKNIFGFNIYYTLGAYLGMNCGALINKSNKKAAIAAAMCFVGILAMGGVFCGNIVYNCAFIFTSWFALDLFPYTREAKWWMKCTFFYYCAHDMVLESIEKVILILFGRSKIMALTDYVMAPALTLMILIGAAWMMRKYFKMIWRILNGGR